MEEDREMKDTIILYPSPGIGHLISMFELGKRFLQLQRSPRHPLPLPWRAAVPASDMPLPIQKIEKAMPTTTSSPLLELFPEQVESSSTRSSRSSRAQWRRCEVDPAFPTDGLLHRTVDRRSGETGGWSRMLGVARLAAEQKRRVLVLWELGGLVRASAQRDCSRVGEERQRFLSVVRSPPSEDKSQRFLAPSEPDQEVLLSEGFLERTKGRGLMVKSWGPQVDVLSHDSVGGFVTHSGWNSVPEALYSGVPMVAWPSYAEQRQNRLVIVKEMSMALPVEEGQDGWVAAEEVERRVRELMQSEEGKGLRERTVEMEEEGMTAMAESGSSRVSLSELAQLWSRVMN